MGEWVSAPGGEHHGVRRARVGVMAEPDLVVNTASDVVAGWFDRHAAAIAAYATRRVGRTSARDVVADTFRVALERFDGFDSTRGAERAWLFGIATNVIRRHWRTEERRLRVQTRATGAEVQPIDPLLSVDDSVDARRAYEHVVDAVAQLSPEDRDLLVLVAWERMSSTEVASVLEIPPGTVRSRLHRIRTQLAEGATHG